MNTRETFIKNIFTVLILFTLPVTSVYAVHDPNSLLNGVYATNSKWQCIASGTPFTNDPSNSVTEVFSTAGEITYFGDGTASEVGRVGITTSDGFADINPYTCDWTYQVNDDGTFTLEADCGAIGINFWSSGASNMIRHKPKMVWSYRHGANSRNVADRAT